MTYDITPKKYRLHDANLECQAHFIGKVVVKCITSAGLLRSDFRDWFSRAMVAFPHIVALFVLIPHVLLHIVVILSRPGNPTQI